MTEPPADPAFGCAACWPDSAEAARAAGRALAPDAELVDESHWHVTIRACRSCGQRFVSVFTETIDWADGDDPQAWTVLPLTPAEAAALRGGGTPSEATLCALGPGRRSLRHDAPKGAPERTWWSTGLTVGPHD